MNRKLLLRLLVAPLMLVVGSELRAQFPGGGPGNGAEDASAAPDAKAEAKPKKVRRPVTVKLPDQYRSKDTDKDGQIGMYEWPRSDYATFRKLDLNGDGFLTAQELIRGPSSKKASISLAAAPKPAVESSPAPGSAAPSTGDSPPSSPSAGSTSEAERFFKLLDKDKNGKVTEDEFEQAGIALKFPVGRDEFIRLYPGPAGAAK